MLLVPFEIGHRLPKLPLVTIVISALWTLLFLFGEDIPRSRNEILRTALHEESYPAHLKKLYTEMCQQQELDKSACQNEAEVTIPLALAETYKSYDAAEIRSIAAGRADLQHLEGCGGTDDYCAEQLGRIRNFISQVETGFRSLSYLAAYEDVSAAQEKAQERLKNWMADSNRLSAAGPTPLALADAQLRHVSIMHLLCSVVVLILLGCAAEGAFPSWMYAAIVLISGSAGALVESLVSPANSLVVAGSALPAAVAGIFYVVFFGSRMRVLCFYPFKFVVIRIPVQYLLPLLLLMSDIPSMLFNMSAGVGVETLRLGQFAAFFSAVFFVSIVNLAKKRSHVFLFQGEEDTFIALTLEQNLDVILSHATLLLAINPNNPFPAGLALQRGFAAVMNDPNDPHRGLIEHFADEHFSNVVAMTAPYQMQEAVLGLFDYCPPEIDVFELLPHTDQPLWMDLARWAAQSQRYVLAFRILDAYQVAFPEMSRSDSVMLSAQSMLAEIHELGDAEALREAMPLLKSRIFKAMADDLIVQMAEETHRAG